MKVKFKYYGAEREIWADRYNEPNQSIIHQPNTSTLRFISLDGAVEVNIKVDERNRLAEQLAIGMQNEFFEFDFSQPLPPNRLNP